MVSGSQIINYALRIVFLILFILFLGFGSFRDIKMAYTELQNFDTLEGSITSIYEIKLKKSEWFRRTRWGNNLIIQINDSISIKLPEDERYRQYWDKINQKKNLYKKIYIYLDKGNVKILEANGSGKRYYTSPVQIEIDSLASKSVSYGNEPLLTDMELQIKCLEEDRNWDLIKLSISNVMVKIVVIAILLIFLYIAKIKHRKMESMN